MGSVGSKAGSAFSDVSPHKEFCVPQETLGFQILRAIACFGQFNSREYD